MHYLVYIYVRCTCLQWAQPLSSEEVAGLQRSDTLDQNSGSHFEDQNMRETDRHLKPHLKLIKNLPLYDKIHPIFPINIDVFLIVLTQK